MSCAYCHATFPNNDLLDRHLEDFRVRESYHASELENCRAHLEHHHEDGHDNHDHEHSTRNDGLDCRANPEIVCPYKECTRRSIAFKSRKDLRRHFRIHVTCEEVCVFCFKISRLASEFIRDANTHKGKTGFKADHMWKMCEELINRADNELERSAKELGRKRRMDSASADLGAPNMKRVFQRQADDSDSSIHQSTITIVPSSTAFVPDVNQTPTGFGGMDAPVFYDNDNFLMYAYHEQYKQ